mgnify:CR=1 FL=1
MSVILDALKRAEEHRQALFDGRRGSDHSHATLLHRRSGRWFWLCSGAVGLAAVLAILWWKIPIGVHGPAPDRLSVVEFRGSVAKDPPSKPVRTYAPKDIPQNPYTETNPGQLARRETEDHSLQPPSRDPHKSEASRGREAWKPAAFLGNAKMDFSRGQKMESPRPGYSVDETTTDGNDSSDSAPTAKKSSEKQNDRIPEPLRSLPAATKGNPQGKNVHPLRIHELPEALREQVSGLEINIHAYYDDPSKCLVFINMVAYREGDCIGENGPLIERITPKGVIVDYGSTRALLEIEGR